MSAPWTPGPWEVAEGDGQYLWEVRAPNEKAKTRRTVARPSGMRRLANAHLIAAAPDLAEACRMFVESYDADAGTYALGKLYEAREAARAALAKARGETP